jgi:hypothetical protein
VTRLFLAGEQLTAGDRDRAALLAWRDALAEAGVLAPTEQLEAAEPASDGSQGRIVIVVREQLDHLNSLYCRAVLALETFESFDSFVDESVASGRHELAEDLAALGDASNTDVVVVPYSHAHPDQATPGPVLMTATRQLHKRLSRARLRRGEDPAYDRRAADRLLERAAAREWDDTTYWGWSKERAAEALEHFGPGNTAFAARWGSDRLDAPTLREQTRLDLAGCRPDVVSDVLTTIQQAIDDAE